MEKVKSGTAMHRTLSGSPSDMSARKSQSKGKSTSADIQKRPSQRVVGKSQSMVGILKKLSFSPSSKNLRAKSSKLSTHSSYSLESVDSDSSTSSQEVDLPELCGGILVFKSDVTENLKQPYVVIGKETSLEDLGTFMLRFWKLPAPEVVLSVISNCKYFTRPHESRIDDFQIGLIQAARLTNMWIMTEGVNTGLPQIIGEAVVHERIRRKNMGAEEDMTATKYGEGNELVVLSVVSSSDLTYGKAIEQSSAPVLMNEKFPMEEQGDDERRLNPHHTHCIVLRDIEQTDKEARWNTRFNVESKLVQFVTKKYWTLHRRAAREGTVAKQQTHSPVVGLMIQGGPNEIERVQWMLKKQIPVICIPMPGAASGLIAYAFYEGLKGGDSQHLESIVKPQLIQQVAKAFPEYCHDNDIAKMQCRDKILDCVKYAVQGDCRYLTILDPSHSGVDLKDLNKYILTAIINSQLGKKDFQSRDKINWNLRLCLHWNAPDFAASKIFNVMERAQFRVKDEVFMEALLLPDREQFVELFLKMGFLIHRFLVPGRYMQLFLNSLQNEFFANICLEKILRIKAESLNQKKFLDGVHCQLNKLLNAVTGLHRLVNPNLLLVAPMATSAVDKQSAERKALLALIYWAVLTNRQGLAKVLWKRTSEPIATALLISNMFSRISRLWVVNIDLRLRIKKASVDFGRTAIEVMDLTFNDSSIMAYHSLITPISDFNHLNVVDLALMGSNIFFIAHPCCQRTIRERWLGKIKIKPFITSFVGVPEFVKIYLCLFLVFPMYFWIAFDTKRQPSVGKDPMDDEFDENNSGTSLKSDRSSVSTTVYEIDPYATPPLWKKIYYMWTAPVSKFWLNQLSLMCYLVLFAVTIMLPYCGNVYLNMTLCFWTLSMFIEHAHRIIWKMRKYPTLKIFWSVLDILIEIYVISVLALMILQQFDFRPPPFLHLTYTFYKFNLSVGMLIMYFRALRYVLPVSQELGPMLINITQLTRRDLINWFRLWMLTMVSGGLAIHIAVHPAQPFSFSVLWHSLMRSGLGLFLTDIGDLEASTIPPYILSRLQPCPHASKAVYIIVLQFLLVSRHVFYTLMFAMFSVTINRTKVRSVEIWKSQFYSIVTDFERRPVLPVPLTPITYPFRILFFIGKWIVQGLQACFDTCCGMNKFRRESRKMTYIIPYNQWKSYLSTITKREGDKESRMEDFIGYLEDGNAAQKVLIKRLNDRLASIEKNQIMMVFTLESLINNVRALDSRNQPQATLVRQTHTASRISPYPGTDIQRFPVLEKDVPWDVKFESYDPITYTKPTVEFPSDLQIWVDVDTLELHPHDVAHDVSPGEEGKPTPSIKQQIHPKYNVIQFVVLSDNRHVQINRFSYLAANDQPLLYEIDATGVPRNPMGRTGLRGRGSLWRWGPNHTIQAVISRWASPAAVAMNIQGAEGSQAKSLEVLVMKDDSDTTIGSLPGGKVLGDQTNYSVLCDSIVKGVFGDTKQDVGSRYDQDKMIEFFSQFASSEMTKKKKSLYASLGYSAFLVYRGYADDPLNTDNAWKEAEIWNFHYKYTDSFENKLKQLDHLTWVIVSSTLQLLPSEMTAVIESAKIHNAHY